MTREEYYIQKATRAKALYEQGLPFVKVYATVRDGGKFIVLEKHKDGKIIYDLSGGGVEDNESVEDAIKRELREELQVEVDIIKKLGVYNNHYRTWRLYDEKFDIRYEIHVFDTVLKKQLKGKKGLDGEFDKDTKIVKIDKSTLLSEVAEFRDFGFKLD